MSQAIFKVGDTIKVYTTDPQHTKAHATVFEGVVISQRGPKDSQTFTVRKISTNNIAVERIFPANSPTIEKITLTKSSSVRRAKLYHLRKK